MGDDDEPGYFLGVYNELAETLAGDGWCLEPVLVRANMQQRRDMRAWIEDTIGPLFEGRRPDTDLGWAKSFQARMQTLASVIYPAAPVYHAFGFRDHSDAVLFRLRWSEHTVPNDQATSALADAW